MTPLAVSLVSFSLALLTLHLVSIGIVILRLRRPSPALVQPLTTSVTLLRPVCGADPFDEETLASSFRQDWPHLEVIFCAPSDTDPAASLVRRLIAAHPETRARLLTGQEWRTGNPKLDNLWKGWQAATGDYVAMADSNLLLPPDYIRELLAHWQPGTGLVTSPPVGQRPDSVGGALEAAFLNGNQARLQLLSDELGQGFAQGKTLFWNRAWLQRQGGIAALGGYLAEDVAATHLVRGAGLKVRLTTRPFAQPIGRRSLRAVWDRQLRWSRVRRDGFPLLFAVEPLNGAALPALALAIAAPLLLAPLLLVWYAAEGLLSRRAGWPSRPRDLAVLPLRDLLLPALWLTTFARRDITWRGTAMVPPSADGAERSPQEVL